jgi:hypothetical protein
VNSNALYNLHPLVLVLSSGYRNISRQDGLEPNKDSIRIEQGMAAIKLKKKKLVSCWSIIPLDKWIS